MSEKVKDPDKSFAEDLQHYRRTLYFMEANVPIQVLCLPKTTEDALLRAGCLRVYDLINRDLGKIKGVGKARLGHLTARLDEFFTVCI